MAFLVKGPQDPSVHICNECIEVCYSILQDRGDETQKTPSSAVDEGEISSKAWSELLSRLAVIKREIEALKKLGKKSNV